MAFVFVTHFSKTPDDSASLAPEKSDPCDDDRRTRQSRHASGVTQLLDPAAQPADFLESHDSHSHRKQLKPDKETMVEFVAAATSVHTAVTLVIAVVVATLLVALSVLSVTIIDIFHN